MASRPFLISLVLRPSSTSCPMRARPGTPAASSTLTGGPRRRPSRTTWTVSDQGDQERAARHGRLHRLLAPVQRAAPRAHCVLDQAPRRSLRQQHPQHRRHPLFVSEGVSRSDATKGKIGKGIDGRAREGREKVSSHRAPFFSAKRGQGKGWGGDQSDVAVAAADGRTRARPGVWHAEGEDGSTTHACFALRRTIPWSLSPSFFKYVLNKPSID